MGRTVAFLYMCLGEQTCLPIFGDLYGHDSEKYILLYRHGGVAADATETNCAVYIAENLPLSESLSVGM